MKKIHLKCVAEYISDFLLQQDSSFNYLVWYSMVLDIIESKLFIEPNQPKKRTIPKYRCHLKFVNKTLDFINLPSILRNPEVLNNCPLNITPSDIPMVVYSLEQPVRSKIFNYHQFVKDLDLNEFVKDPNSINCSCSHFDSAFTNNDHGHIITGDLRIVQNNELRKLYTKGPKFREPVELDWNKAKSEIGLGLEQYILDLSLKKGIDKNVFSGWKQYIINLVENKIQTLKNRIKPNKVPSVLKDKNVKSNLKELQSKFVLVPIDKAANNVAFICKQFYAAVISKELQYSNIINNINLKNSTYELLKSHTKEEIIKSHKTFLAKYKLEINNNMEILPSIYWLPKIHKTPVGFRFIIASPKCSLKPLAKDITALFKLFYKKVERYHCKGRVWSGIKKFWVIQNNKPVTTSIEKLNKRNSAKSLSTFDFSTLYTKIPHGKLLDVLNEVIDFCFKGGTRDRIIVTNSTAYWIKNNTTMKGTIYTKDSIKSALKYLMENCFFQVGNLTFKQVIGIPMGSDPAPFFANLFLHHYESEWLGTIKNQEYQRARKFSNAFRFIDDLIIINDSDEFLRSCAEIYPKELELKKEITTKKKLRF